ncbi:MAG TPA: aminopeptidase, partial [Algoriphagus sp.]|nr:aminopeptidase [Algoriphagus sp.]
QRGPQSEAPLVAESSINSRMTLGTLQGILWENDEYGYKVLNVKDAQGNPLSVAVNKTMMRIDLPMPLKAGESFTFAVDWSFNITDRISYISG